MPACRQGRRCSNKRALCSWTDRSTNQREHTAARAASAHCLQVRCAAKRCTLFQGVHRHRDNLRSRAHAQIQRADNVIHAIIGNQVFARPRMWAIAVIRKARLPDSVGALGQPRCRRPHNTDNTSTQMRRPAREEHTPYQLSRS